MRTLAFVFALLVGNAASAATLNINGGGQLTGANDVDIGGEVFDVSFIDGTCAAVFDGCDQTSDFLFQTEGAAELAADALLAQVLLDGLLGNFDTSPGLTTGCFPNQFGVCHVLIPFAITTRFQNFPVEYRSASNGIPSDGIGTGALGPLNDFAGSGDIFGTVVFAKFTPAVVPLPAAGWLLLAGLGFLGATRVSRRAS